jgi:hypothetical protein
MLLGASLAVALGIVAASHLLVRGAQRVADTKAYRAVRDASLERLRSLSTPARLATRRRSAASAAAPSPGSSLGLATIAEEGSNHLHAPGPPPHCSIELPRSPATQPQQQQRQRQECSGAQEPPSLAMGSGSSGGGTMQRVAPAPASSSMFGLSDAQLAAPATLGDVVAGVRHLEQLLQQRRPPDITVPGPGSL